jgi:hypothetical protein
MDFLPGRGRLMPYKNKAEQQAASHRWYLTNKESVQARLAKWRNDHPEECKATDRAWREANKEQRTPTSGRSNATMAREQKVNDHVALAKSPSNLMQRLPRLPTAPHVGPLRRGKPRPSPSCHKHHL